MFIDKYEYCFTSLLLEEEIDRMAFLDLTESMIARLIPKIGPQAKCFKKLQALKEEILKDKVYYIPTYSIQY